jgi:hypothetical protein
MNTKDPKDLKDTRDAEPDWEALRRYLDVHSEELAEEMIREDVEWGLRGDDPQPRRGGSV